ncbi:MAG: hypothetical protein ABI910_02890 [Gemmatimonadota bacterium]
MTPHVALVYFEGCPHADEARRRMAQALTAAGLDSRWDEWDTGSPATPEPYRRFGSPTVLVDGTDVAGGVEGSGMGCVVGGAPAIDDILAALRSTAPNQLE